MNMSIDNVWDMNKGQANTELLGAQHSFDVVFGDGRHSLANYYIWLKYHIWGGSALTVFWGRCSKYNCVGWNMIAQPSK